METWGTWGRGRANPLLNRSAFFDATVRFSLIIAFFLKLKRPVKRPHSLSLTFVVSCQ